MTRKRPAQTCLFGDTCTSTAPRQHGRPEAAALHEVMRALRNHPAVAWAERQNSGAFRTPEGQFVRFGWKGCSDVIGQLRDGRLLAVEVKSPTGHLSPEQQQFLDTVNQAGGCAFVARNCADVHRKLSANDSAPLLSLKAENFLNDSERIQSE